MICKKRMCIVIDGILVTFVQGVIKPSSLTVDRKPLLAVDKLRLCLPRASALIALLSGAFFPEARFVPTYEGADRLDAFRSHQF